MQMSEYHALRDATCSLEGCERPTEFIGGRYCRTHALRVKRTGSPGSPTIREYNRKGK